MRRNIIYVPEVSLVVLVFCQALDGGHENVVVAQKVLKDELGEGVAEARAGGRVQHVDLDGDVQLLSCGRRQPQETVLQAVLDDVLLIRPY